MSPKELALYLDAIVSHNIQISTMLWGPPGVGKSSIVAQTAQAHQLQFVDLRLSQLAPTDLRGLPVPENGISRWFPPEFLPQSGAGILFLDELNMAPPTMQGMAQQLILDRRVGSYQLPDNWFVWAAGNRKEDRGAVFDMPAPLANRFVHLEVEADLDSFKSYALQKGLHERILAFLSFRPALLHHPDPKHPAWPSPRSWEMASRLLQAKLDIAPVVGKGAAEEFAAFEQVYAILPELGEILQGHTQREFPQEPSARYAITLGLAMRVENAVQGVNAFGWMAARAPLEWVQLFVFDLKTRLEAIDAIGEWVSISQSIPEIGQYFPQKRGLVTATLP